MAGSGSAWADEVVTLWSEDFSSYSANDVPSGGTYSYACANGGSTTKIYNEELAGGTAPELLVSKSNGTFTATVPLDNIEGDLTLTFYTNKQSIDVGTTTEGISGSLSEKAAGQHTLTFGGVTTSMTEIVIVFKGSGSSNVRLDNIVLTGTKKTSDPNAPSVILSDPSLDFGDVLFGKTKEMTFTVTPANLTSDLTVSCNNSKYEVSPSSIAKETTAETTVTVTAKPTAIDDDMDGKITISGGGLTSEKTISLSTTVISRDAVDPVGPAGSGDKYVKVTSTNDITDGQYLIVYETDKVAFNGGLETLDAGNNVISISFNDNNEIVADNYTKAAEFTINATDGSVKSKSGYYIGITTYGNGLKTSADISDDYKNSITVDEDENVLISRTFDNGTMTLWFNSNSGDNNYRFRYYKSLGTTNKPVQLYKYVPGELAESFDVAVGAAGWRTLVTSVDATLPEGLTAYVVTEYTAEKATLDEVTSVKAENAYLLKGAEGTYTLTSTETATAPESNLLKISDATTGNGVYVLANKSNGVGFYRWAGGSLGAGRVYLDVPNAAREFIGFGIDETTAIEGVAANVLYGQFFDLQGRRVAQPQKGLYIVNGKKVVIK